MERKTEIKSKGMDYVFNAIITENSLKLEKETDIQTT